jgi:internalin A
LAWQFCRPERTIWRGRFGDLIPLPFVLRELRIGKDITWEGLLDTFLEHPMAKPLETKERIEDILKRGQGLLLFDGLDEIGSIEVRKALHKAVENGMDHFPKCHWLLTSRIVGYDECAFPAEKIASIQPMVEEKLRLFVRRLKATLIMSKVRYAAPFNDQQISQFAFNWYHRHEKAEDKARSQAEDLVRSIRAHDSILPLARIPNLLTFISLIHRVFRVLPHGRAMLYDRITEAYLESIDKFRGISEAHFPLARMKRWLAYVGYQMQVKPKGKESEARDEREILAERGEVLTWLTDSMRKWGVQNADGEADWFLGFLGRRSGLFLPRSADRFAFTHLSFQEYFAACYLEELITVPDGLPDQSADDLSWISLRESTGRSSWREVFIFLFELVAERKGWPEHLFKRLFKSSLNDTPGQTGKEAVSTLRLLAAVSVDPHSGLPEDLRKEAWDKAWRWDLSSDMESFDDLMAPILLATQTVYEPQVWDSIQRLWKETQPKKLDLSDCQGVTSLHPIRNLTNLEQLSLGRCVKVTDLSPLKGLQILDVLTLGSTGVTDLSPLQGLQNLAYLSLDSTGVTDLSPLHGLQKLEWLSLDSTGVTDLSPLQGLQNLQALSLDSTGVTDLSPLKGLQDLQALSLDSTGVTDLSPLQGLQNLQLLYLDSTGVTDLSPLQRLQNLKRLYLDSTGVTDLSPLQGLQNLQELHLNSTGVTDLSPLQGLASLEWLGLRGCSAAKNIPDELKNRPGLKIFT